MSCVSGWTESARTGSFDRARFFGGRLFERNMVDCGVLKGSSVFLASMIQLRSLKGFTMFTILECVIGIGCLLLKT